MTFRSIPDLPQSAHDTRSSFCPVFLFSVASPRQKSQYFDTSLWLLTVGVTGAGVTWGVVAVFTVDLVLPETFRNSNFWIWSDATVSVQLRLMPKACSNVNYLKSQKLYTLLHQDINLNYKHKPKWFAIKTNDTHKSVEIT